jgi:5'-nucleotidase
MLDRILITNDDGIDAPGLAVLERIAGELAREIWVVAPEHDQRRRLARRQPAPPGATQ